MMTVLHLVVFAKLIRELSSLSVGAQHLVERLLGLAGLVPVQFADADAATTCGRRVGGRRLGSCRVGGRRVGVWIRLGAGHLSYLAGGSSHVGLRYRVVARTRRHVITCQLVVGAGAVADFAQT